MSRFRLDLEYEGTRYAGWQIQKNARTVQGALSDAVVAVCKTQRFDLGGAGRTDAGVHAMCQTAHLGIETRLPAALLKNKLNDELPADINILRIRPAPPAFHARHDALARTYLYQIARRRTAFGKRFVWWIKDTLNAARMQEAARLFVGSHDFRSFCAVRDDEKETRVSLTRCDVEENGDLLLVRLEASHFLWKMVRQMVGTLVEVGRGKLQPADVQRFLTSPSDVPARLTAPPSGLFLAGATYAGSTPAVEPLLRLPGHGRG
jgi:tRNA pseudouridine38-40 synthase